MLVLRGRRHREGGRGRRPRLLLLRRPTVHLHRAVVRPRVDRRRLPGALRRPHQGHAARHVPRVRRGHGLAGRRAPAGDRHPARRRGRREGRQGRRGRRGPPRHRPVLLRADDPRRRRGADGRVHRGDLRPGRLRLPLHGRGRGGRARQLHAVRPQRLASGRRTAAAAARSPPALRAGTVNVNEGYASAYGSVQSPDGRHEGLRPRPPPRLRGHPQVHRGPDGRPAAAAADGAVPRHGRREVRGSS